MFKLISQLWNINRLYYWKNTYYIGHKARNKSICRAYIYWLILLIVILIFAIIFIFLSSFIYKGIIAIIDGFEKNIQNLTCDRVSFWNIRTLVGLVFATLIGIPISRIHFVIGPILFI